MRRWFALLALHLAGLLAGRAGAAAADAGLGSAYTEATVDKVKTSIYVGNVTLDMPPFQRGQSRYASTYSARVFPYFFYNEKGRIEIELTDEDLRKLAAGERVPFSGRAENLDGEPRRVEGHATPDDALSGTIKVRVWVSPKIELIFNSRYRFTGR